MANMLKDHNDKNCSCYQKNSKKECVYATFPDGWDFIPDVGNGNKRGEVFTPLWIVNKMITDSGILPKTIITDKNYSQLSKKESLELINKTVNEPAVGTANFTSTILYHKLRLIPNIINNPTENINDFHKILLTTISKNYCFDIDAGNLQTTMNRLLGDKKPLNHKSNVEYWVNHIAEKLETKPTIEQIQEITQQVIVSLTEAYNNWDKFTNTGVGVIDSFYEEQTGRKVPVSLRKQIFEIFDKNILLFNGIQEEDSVKGFYCPGWGNVEWVFWDFDKNYRKPVKNVQSLSLMIKTSRLEQVKKSLNDTTMIVNERKKLEKEQKDLEADIYGVNVPGSLFDM